MRNTKKFRQAALHYLEHGVYTKLVENSREWLNWWKEEQRRSIEGYTAPDGDYIPGYFYFYLNYCPIYLVEPIPDANGNLVYEEDGTIKGHKKLDFPRFWDGDLKYFLYLDQAENIKHKHACVLKARRRGYSYKAAAMLNRNFFLIPGSKSYAIASTKEYLIKDGVLSKTWEMMDFINEHTAWKKRRQVKDTDLHKRASYKATINGNPVEKGYMSEIIGVTLMNNPNRARGKSGKLIIFEEAGSFPHLVQAWTVARPSVEQSGSVYGLMVAFGTGGEEGANFDGLDELFSSPKGHGVHAIPNEWEDTDKPCAFFSPEYMNKEGFMDEDGNTDIVRAKEACEAERQVVQEHTRDRHALKRYIAEHPNTPREAMMRLEGNIFPTQDILKTLARLELDRDYEKSIYKGKMIIDVSGNIEFEEDRKAKVIYNFPLKKGDDTNGPVIIYEQPYRQDDGNIPHGIYIAGIDPYDHDQSSTSSLGSIFIINKLTNRIVAEYTARPDTSADFYEQCRRLLIYYNARALYENEKKGIFDYFSSKNCLHLLCSEPRLIHDVLKKVGTTRHFGLKMPEQIKRYGENLIYQWLVKDYDLDKNIKNYHKIRSIGLLKELASYNPEKNYDRVMALMCLVYQLEEERSYIPDIEKPRKSKLTDSSFFNKPLFGNSAYRAIKGI